METALHYLFPLLSFLLGVFAAEWIRSLCERVRVLHWRQVILLGEIILLVFAGLFPDTMATFANVLLSFACAMQVESFRKFRGIPCATTMCIGTCAALRSIFIITFVPMIRSRNGAASIIM